ncbi:tetratricopeptide repeat protein [Parasedimentitalea marina]|uniref:Tetratricopeptide repeat protein n=1 Tax=Parasedimentitalea marina TaxID=2483033 RepID=A0A3T0N0L3_9RHOB|nr:tetratricopeptide repeat protein [Parasedimentitalea marina]AZV77512.1 tetratricopeptide repeat protein [Parasedimentitalea marina]
MNDLIENWGGLFDIAVFLVAVAGVSTTAILLVHRNRTVTKVADIEQERDALRMTNVQQAARLNAVDPERFLDTIADLTSRADYRGQDTAAGTYIEAHAIALGRAAEILAEQRILDSESDGKDAAYNANRYARLGLAACPGSGRLVALEKFTLQRAQDIDLGHPIEVLDWDQTYDVDLKRLSVELFDRGHYQLAEIVARRSVALTEKGSGHFPGIVALHGKVLAKLGVYDAAEPLCRAAVEASRKMQDTNSSDYSSQLNNLADLLQTTRRYDEAEPLYREALVVIGKTRGTEHPDYVAQLNKLAGLLESAGRPGEAKPLYHEVLKIGRKALGAAYPDFDIDLKNQARVLHQSGRSSETEPLHREAQAVFERVRGMATKVADVTHESLDAEHTTRPN